MRQLANPQPGATALRCTCRHLVTSHRINVTGFRAHCQVGRCGCRLFVWAKAVAA